MSHQSRFQLVPPPHEDSGCWFTSALLYFQQVMLGIRVSCHVAWAESFLTSALPSVGVPCACQITSATLTTHGVRKGMALNIYLISFLVVLIRSSPAGTRTKGWQEGPHSWAPQQAHLCEFHFVLLLWEFVPFCSLFSANSRHKMLRASDSKRGANIE